MLSTSLESRKRLPAFFRRLEAYANTAQFRSVIIAVLGSALAAALFMAALSPTRYNLSVGMVPNITIAATRDVIDEITTENNRRLAANSVTPTYKQADGVTDEVLTRLDEVVLQLSAVRQYAKNLPDYSASRRYTQEELDYALKMLTLVEMREYQLQTLMNSPQEQFDEVLSSLKAALRNTMQGHVTQGQENTAINSIMQVVGYRTNVSLLQNVVLPALKAVILPNMVIDADQTETAKQAAMDAVEPVTFKEGQNIVVKGEGPVRANQIATLEKLGLLHGSQSDFGLHMGSFLTSALIFLTLGFLIRFAFPALFLDHRRLLVFYLTLIAAVLLAILAKSIQLIYVAPLLLPAMLLTVLLGMAPAMIAQVVLFVMASLIFGAASGSSGGEAFIICAVALLSGTVSALILKLAKFRSQLLIAGAGASLISFSGILAIGLIGGKDAHALWIPALLAAGGSMLSAGLSLALQPLLETLFNLPTYNRLMELSNPTHPLLRRLLLEAPGTYHHSLLIANLAENAAEAVGADPLLARVGGYYHDIGKLKRPLYFKENQIGTSNVHDQTDPSVSAAIITSHVRDGLALAKQYRLPPEIQNIIAHHHGNSRLAYFYSKAMQGAETVDEQAFRYEGEPPTQKETALVMLCDTIEAAVRTLNKPSREEISAFIWKLIRTKFDEGQLANAPLTMKELADIQEACSRVVHGIFHERIEYPKDERKGTALRFKTPTWATATKPLTKADRS